MIDNSKQCHRGAFSLVELLVVIAIVAILMALLLPAIQAARDAAHRLQCINNLKQLALAVQNYQSGMRVYPAAAIIDTTAAVQLDLRSGPMFSWIVLILPYLEQAPLHGEFDFNRSVFDQPNEPQDHIFPSLLCPSDSDRGKYFQHPELTFGKRVAKGNYAAYVSPYHVDFQIFRGALVTGRTQRPAHVRDGLSNSLLISEVRTRNHEQDQRGAWALPWAGASLLAFDMHPHDSSPSNLAREVPVYVPAAYSLGLTQTPNASGVTVDLLYDCPDIATAQLDEMPCGVYDSQPFRLGHYLSAAPRSHHPGGVNVVFLDGHTAFITDSIDEIAMAYMVCINDEAPVSLSNHTF